MDPNNSTNNPQISIADREKVISLTHDTSKDPEWNRFFENMHLFSNYFVENNADVVIQKYEEAMAKRTALLQKQKHQKRKRTISQFSKQKSIASASLKKNRDQLSSKGINEPKSPKKESWIYNI